MVSCNARTKQASMAKYISISNIIQGEVDPTKSAVVISTPLLDLNYVEDSAGGPDVTVGILPKLDKVTLLQFDHVYLGSPNIVAVLDHERKQTYVIRRECLSDVVVWNPWDKKAKAMTDMGFDEYRRMVCVDGAVVANPITLKPGKE
nr:putative glucose-6-phosphate 1-epimerase [Tanacetum cinerariifolium]